MLMYLLIFFLVTTLLVLLSTLMSLVSFSKKVDLEKNSPFECGFLGYEESRSPFSIHFFMISLIFLIFDIELILIFPFMSSAYCGPNLFLTSMLVVFILILSLGLALEWEKSMLEWRE